MKKMLAPVAILLLAVMIFSAFSGCTSPKTAITAADFKRIAEEKGLTVEDTTGTPEGEIFTGSLKASSADGWAVSFFTIDTAANAKDYFATCKSFMESLKTGAGTAQTTERENWSMYTQTNGGKFMYCCYIDTTMVYVNVDEAHKTAVQEFVKALGY